jgi:hypothetical protein
MDGAAPVLATTPSKPAKKLDAPEKAMAGILILLGALLIIGTLVWFGLSTENGSLLSKEVTTHEPVGEKPTGEKTTSEKNYADDVVIFALTIGAVMTLSGAFFGRIREIKFGGNVISMQAPEPVKQEAEAEAATRAEKKAPDGKKEKAAAIAKSYAGDQVDLMYVTAPPSVKPLVAETVANAAAQAAVKAVGE